MQQLTPRGQEIVNDLSNRYGFSSDAVTHMMIAVLNGNGTMAQFNHPEFAGSGQWMSGGMTMLGDMFNNGLKYSVEGLCSEISNILAAEPGLLRQGSFQSQSQSGSGQQSQAAGGIQGESSLFIPDPTRHWWPKEMGSPSATGSQNNVRYAYFADQNRLAVETNGNVWIYDTLNHQIGGFSQQQGVGGSILFTSQFGTVNLSTLPVVSINGTPPQNTQPAPPNSPAPNSYANQNNQPVEPSPSSHESDIFSAIERLGGLKDKGLLTEDEFAQKKADLLERL
ncbi:MAG: SHOCT domain-containing protein [Pseudomonadales bacterium]|nr:SHOCT domain-containing protein [Pseudomonadales bacterium]